MNCQCRVLSSGIYSHIVRWKQTHVTKGHIASIFRIEEYIHRALLATWFILVSCLAYFSRPLPLYPRGNRPSCGPRGGLGVVENIKHFLTLPTIELRILGRPVHSLVTIPTELSRLLLLYMKILSRVWSVTIDGVWTNNRIYLTLKHTTRNYT
jgi:hypothetical protein